MFFNLYNKAHSTMNANNRNHHHGSSWCLGKNSGYTETLISEDPVPYASKRLGVQKLY